LGEIAYILQRPKEAFALLDISLKLYKNIDPENILKYKNLALLGGLLSQQNQNSMMQNIYKSIFKSLEKFEPETCFEKVFALKKYGFLLARSEETRLEGNDYIKKAEQMEKLHPYWAERKMNLFVPVMTIDETQLI
jgi:sulfur relay (sulfurtransferase) DsrF/TusC family protein